MAEVQLVFISWSLDTHHTSESKGLGVLASTLGGDAGGAWAKAGIKSLRELVVQAVRLLNWRREMNRGTWHPTIASFFADLRDSESLLRPGQPLPSLPLPTGRPWKEGNREARISMVMSKLDDLKLALESHSPQGLDGAIPGVAAAPRRPAGCGPAGTDGSVLCVEHGRRRGAWSLR